MAERLCEFNIYAISVLSFLGSVCAPDKATLKAENHALQCTTAGPYNAMPSNLLKVGSVCGLGPYLVGIHSISLAARYELLHVRQRSDKALRTSRRLEGMTPLRLSIFLLSGRKSCLHHPWPMAPRMLSVLFVNLVQHRTLWSFCSWLTLPQGRCSRFSTCLIGHHCLRDVFSVFDRAPMLQL